MTMMMTLADAHALLPGSTLVGDGATAIARVHSDTRSLKPGDLFVALEGERFVLPLIAVTGSNGKTTVTQMVADILRAWVGVHAFSTEGNLNNHIGVPLTLLRLRQDEATWHKAGVIELGMNHPGEIALLSGLVKPTVALVNNAQREHQEFMASVEAVARENGAVIEALGPTGVAVFPADEAHAPLWQRLAGRRPQLTFAMDPAFHGAADVVGTAAWEQGAWALTLHTPVGTTQARLRVAGRHNLKNALAAATCALAAGAPLEAIARGLEAFEPVKGRSQLKAFERDGQAVTLIDDSYNANPDSVRAAIDVLAELPAPQWLVLGDMGEVGTQGPQFHAEVGAYARERGLPALWTCGAACGHAARAYGSGARHFADVPQLLAALPQAPQAASVLVKGSRFMRMEHVVQALLAEPAGAKGGA